MNARADVAIPREARDWAMVCHLIALVGLLGNGIGFLLGPLIMWLLKRSEHPFVDEQGKEAVNFQITMFVIGVVILLVVFFEFFAGMRSGRSVSLGSSLFLVLLFPLLTLFDVVFSVIAGIAASKGRHYRYPFALRLLS